MQRPGIVTHSSEPVQADSPQNKCYYIEETPIRRLAVLIIRPLFPLAVSLSIGGEEHMPAQGAVVLAANHLTNFDIFPIQLAVLPRPIYFMAKAELHANRWLDALLRQLGSFPVKRGARDEWAMEHARKVLEKGQVLGIFPEGTRSRDHSLRTAKTGAARLALAMGCPIVPLAVTGTPDIFRKGLKRARVEVQLGQPIYPAAHDTPLGLTDRLMFALAEMLPADMRGVYAEHPQGF